MGKVIIKQMDKTIENSIEAPKPLTLGVIQTHRGENMALPHSGILRWFDGSVRKMSWSSCIVCSGADSRGKCNSSQIAQMWYFQARHMFDGGGRNREDSPVNH